MPEIRVLAVDLAARYSAASVIGSSEDGKYEVVWEDDSSGLLDRSTRMLHAPGLVRGPEWRWVTMVEYAAQRFVLYEFSEDPDRNCVAIEDQPHGVRFDTTAKHVARIQGRLIDRFARTNTLDRVWFVQPSRWMREIPGVWRQGPKGQLAAAIELGYHPPEFGPTLVGRGTGQVRAVARKIQEDYVSSYLIGVWACKRIREHGSLECPNSQRYVEVGNIAGGQEILDG